MGVVASSKPIFTKYEEFASRQNSVVCAERQDLSLFGKKKSKIFCFVIFTEFPIIFNLIVMQVFGTSFDAFY